MTLHVSHTQLVSTKQDLVSLCSVAQLMGKRITEANSRLQHAIRFNDLWYVRSIPYWAGLTGYERPNDNHKSDFTILIHHIL